MDWGDKILVISRIGNARGDSRGFPGMEGL